MGSTPTVGTVMSLDSYSAVQLFPRPGAVILVNLPSGPYDLYTEVRARAQELLDAIGN